MSRSLRIALLATAAMIPGLTGFMVTAQEGPEVELFGPPQGSEEMSQPLTVEAPSIEVTEDVVEDAGPAPSAMAEEVSAETGAGPASPAGTPSPEAVTVVEEARVPVASPPPGATPATIPIAPAPVAVPAAKAKPDQAALTREAAQEVGRRTTFVSPGPDGRVVQVYGESIPTLVCQPGMTCLVELEPGEEVLDTPVLSDTVRWHVQLRHRDTAVPQTYFVFKPSPDAPALANFIIFTDRRVYTINLVKDLLVSTPILSFEYPDTRARKMAQEIEDRKKAAARKASAAKAARAAETRRTGVSTTKGTVPAGELDFKYTMRGKAAFKPLRVYNDGRKTYVDLPQSYRGDLPVVIGGSGEANRAFNYRTAKNGQQIIIDKVLSRFDLKNGRQTIRVKKGS